MADRQMGWVVITVRRIPRTNPRLINDARALHVSCFGLDVAFPDGMTWGAYDGQRLVGYAVMAPSQTWQATGYLSMAGVHQDYRGRGLQKRLIRARVRHAKRIGWKYVITYTIDNPPSENSLISCGFRRYSPADPYVKGTVNYWRKLM